MALDVTRKLNEIRNKFTLRNLIRSGKIEEATYRMDDGRWVTINGTHVFIENGKVEIGPEPLKSELKKSGKDYSEAKQAREMKLQMKQKPVETGLKQRKPYIDPVTADIRERLMAGLEEDKKKKAKSKNENQVDPYTQDVLRNLKAEQEEQKRNEKPKYAPPEKVYMGPVKLKDPNTGESLSYSEWEKRKIAERMAEHKQQETPGQINVNDPQDKTGGNSTNQRILDILNSDPNTLPKPNYAKEENNNFREKPNRALQHLGENKYADTDPVSVEDIPGLQVSKKTLKRLYEGNLVGLQKQVYVPVNGTKHTQEYIDEQLKQHPDLESYSEHFKGYRNAVKYFVERNQQKGQDSIPDGTYDINTGEKKDFDRGYSVTFHQNLSKDNPLGGYNDKQYATMCAIAMRELKSDGTYVGYFQGSPEISFHCNNFNDAMKFAIEHNQKSIWDCERQAEFENPYYNRKTNPT